MEFGRCLAEVGFDLKVDGVVKAYGVVECGLGKDDCRIIAQDTEFDLRLDIGSVALVFRRHNIVFARLGAGYFAIVEAVGRGAIIEDFRLLGGSSVTHIPCPDDGVRCREGTNHFRSEVELSVCSDAGVLGPVHVQGHRGRLYDNSLGGQGGRVSSLVLCGIVELVLSVHQARKGERTVEHGVVVVLAAVESLSFSVDSGGDGVQERSQVSGVNGKIVFAASQRVDVFHEQDWRYRVLQYHFVGHDGVARFNEQVLEGSGLVFLGGVGTCGGGEEACIYLHRVVTLFVGVGIEGLVAVAEFHMDSRVVVAGLILGCTREGSLRRA